MTSLSALSGRDSDIMAECGAWLAQARPEYGQLVLAPDQRWTARSALQKAVRRGDERLASRLGLGLLGLHPGYTFSALTTIALEDVGFGSPECVTWANAGRLNGFRRAVGEADLVSALILEMCAALKTRSSCELSFLVDEGAHPLLRQCALLPTDELLSRVESQDAAECYAALAVLRGLLPAGFRRRESDPKGVAAALEIMEAQLPASLARAAGSAYLRPLDSMAIAFFPAARLGQRVESREIRRDNFPPSADVNGILSEAYDQHERLGRRAIRRLAGELRSEVPALAALPSASAITAVGDAVFVEEGALLDRWFAGDELTELRLASDELSMTRHGLVPERGRAVREVVRTCIPRLNDHRRGLAEEF